jgi:uncharacterized surface protein with fasciclin (FAS1) repeats
MISLFIATISVNAQKVSSSIDSTKLASAKKQLTTFLRVLNSVGMDTIFKGESKTILAPDDEAFAKLHVGTLDSLSKPANKAVLINLLNNHVIAGKLSAKDIAKLVHANNGQATFITLSGVKLTATINANRNIVLTDENGNESIVKQFDIADGSTVIYVLSSVILPKK